jgi:hypothetical protein
LKLLFAKKGPPTGGLKLAPRFEALDSLARAFRKNRQLSRATSAMSLLPLFIIACFLWLAGIVAQAQVIVTNGFTYYRVDAVEGQAGGLWSQTITVNTIGLGTVQTAAGEFMVTMGSVQAPNQPISFYGYCMDLAHYSLANYYATPLDIAHLPSPIPNVNYSGNFSSSDAPLRAAYLYNTFASSAHNNSDNNANTKAAGLQAAIWETLYNNYDGLGFDPVPYGSTYSAIQNAVHAQAVSYLTQGTNANWGNYTADATWWKGSAAANGGNEAQGLIGPVPEPAEIGLAILLLLALVSIYEVKQRRARLAKISSI